MLKKELQEKVKALEEENKMWRKKIIEFAKVAIDELNCDQCRKNRIDANTEISELMEGMSQCCGGHRIYEPLDGHHYCEECQSLA
jgi:hypothetical protein